MSDLPVSLVVAAADNDVIGRNNALPWDLPADLKHFRRLTMGRPVLMGRRTFESIGRPLPGRSNIVISRDPAYRAEGVHSATSLEAALTLAGNMALIDDSDALMVIGGAQIYAEALPLAARLHLTRVHATPAGDTYLPPIDWTRWRETSRQTYAATGDGPAYSFLDYTRLDA